MESELAPAVLDSSTSPASPSPTGCEHVGITVAELESRFPSLFGAETDGQRQDRERREAEWETFQQRAASQERRESLARFMDRIGERYRECTLANFETDTSGQYAAIETLRRFIGSLPSRLERGEGLLLFGPPGTGKDHLMVAAAREAVAHGATVHWLDGMEFYADVRDAISSDRPESELLRRLIEPRVLCISDPIPPIVAGNDRSRGTLSDYQAQTMFRVIDRRYRQRKSTWATLNVSGPQELSERISGPIYDRLRDGAVTIPCDWPSYRRSR